MQDFIGDCGHPLPHYPAFTDEHTSCNSYCRDWFEPDWNKDEDEEPENVTDQA